MPNLIDALATAQQHFDDSVARYEMIGDAQSCNSYLVYDYRTDLTLEPRNDLDDSLLTTISKFRSKKYDCFVLCDMLKMWDVTKLCRKAGLFRKVRAGTYFCIQVVEDHPFFVKIATSNNTAKVVFSGNIAMSFEDFLHLLLGQYPSTTPSYDTLHEFWLATGKKFNWAKLPNELKWTVFEHMNEGEILRPYFYKRGHPSSRLFMSRDDAEQHAAVPAMQSQVELVTPGGFFAENTLEYNMIEKTAVRSNVFIFDRPSFLSRWLQAMDPRCLQQIRSVRLTFTHGDFIRFWNSDLQPRKRGHSSFVEAAKMLGQLHLDHLILEPRLSEDMLIHSYFSQPQAFGCHEKAMSYIAGLACRNLPNTKKIVFAGYYYRPMWQPALDDIFRAVKAASSNEKREVLYTQAKFQSFAADNKLTEIIEREKKKQRRGGVKVSRRRSQPNHALTHADHQQFEQGTDLPDRHDSEEDGILWECECHDRCGEDYFNNRDPPPPPPPVVRKKKAVSETKARPQNGQQQEAQADTDDVLDNWMPENTEYNGADFWLE